MPGFFCADFAVIFEDMPVCLQKIVSVQLLFRIENTNPGIIIENMKAAAIQPKAFANITNIISEVFIMNVPFVLTPGPTYINDSVRNEMSRELSNPDIDPSFYDFYKNTCEKLQRLMDTKNDVLIMCGEGILGLEAACASLTEEGDRVLVIDNGIFGAGFSDFIELYGGNCVFFRSDYKNEINVSELESFLKKDSDFKYATVVHCETPSGISNPVDKICPLLKSFGILTVVDSVSGIGGEELHVDKWDMDIVLGGSQKCLSAPVGLTFLSVSPDAHKAISSRKTPIKSFYCSIAAFDGWYEKKWFPYTMPIHIIYALDKAVSLILDDNYTERHNRIASAIRYAINKAGLEIYAESGFSNTVTAVNVPPQTSFEEIQKYILEDFGILVGGSFGYLSGKVIRIGHMGENCKYENMSLMLKALDAAMRKAGVPLKGSLPELFEKGYNEYTSK